MFRKIILGIATLALVGVAFAIYVWREEPGPITRKRVLTESRRRDPVTTQPSASQPAAFSFQTKDQSVRVSPGQGPRYRDYDPRTGEARIVVEAKEILPIRENEFSLPEPRARVLLPGGQLAYVRADMGQIKVASGDSKNLVPKSGWFKGNVEILIDRSKPEWRREHPDQAAPEQHPDAVVKIWLDDARFDMDLARLESDGNVIVQSPQATIEGKGLELAWNEADRRLRKLRIVTGKRAVIYNAGLGEFGVLPGETQPAGAEGSAPEGDTLLALAPPAASQPALAATEEETPATAPAGQIGFLDPDDARPRPDRVDTYELVFRDNVSVRQINGLKTVASLKAEVLTLLRDFGRDERDAVQYTSSADGSGRVATTASAPADVKTKKAPRLGDTESTVEIAWTGEVLVEPLAPPSTQEAEQKKPKRTHVKAEGDPVEIVDARRGRIVCSSFEYHMETKQGWLTGSAQEPLVMNAGTDRKLVVEKSLFFDQKNGEVRIDGPGQMLQARRDQEAGEAAIRPALAAMDSPTGTPSEMQIAWRDAGQIVFEQSQPKATEEKAGDGSSREKSGTYLKSAHFTGKVVAAGVGGRSIAADKLDVTFLPPRPNATGNSAIDSPLTGGDLVGGTDPDRIIAVGHVRMGQQRDHRQTREERRLQRHRDVNDSVECDRLEIEMARDDTGASYPRIGTAIGQVLARQRTQQYMGAIKVGSPLVRDIRANDTIILEMASIPDPPSEERIAELRALAARQGITPDSEVWQRNEARLRNRRQLVNQRLTARGKVSATDRAQNLGGLSGETLECTFDDEQKISKALLVGTEDAPAHVEQDTFHIRGQRLSLDMSTETVEVPGKGMLRFYSDQDIDGRPVEEKRPVVVTWQRDMWLRGSENVGLFQGEVRVTSENNVMEARELRLRFDPAAVATAPASATRPADEWLAGPLLDVIRSRPRERSSTSLAMQRERKLSRVDAFGEVVIVSSSYRPPSETLGGRLDRFISDRTPKILRRPATAPAEPDRIALLSRIRLAGPQVRIDLADMQLLVEGKGSLLVEDYRLPKSGGMRSRAQGPEALLTSSVVPGVDSLGPSQTLFTWENSMSFLSRDNVATFDRNVAMVHQAGTAMAGFNQIEALRGLDESAKKRLTSRVAGLTCGNLVAQFETARSREGKTGPSPLSAATGLKAFWARRGDANVRLVDREAKVHRVAEGSLMYYDGQTNEARITGSEQLPAVVQAIDPKTGNPLNWRGQEVTWNLKTGEVRLEKSQILAPGR